VLLEKYTNLDSLIKSGEQSSDIFLWINTQGYEGTVLVGALIFLGNKPTLLKF